MSTPGSSPPCKKPKHDPDGFSQECTEKVEVLSSPASPDDARNTCDGSGYEPSEETSAGAADAPSLAGDNEGSSGEDSESGEDKCSEASSESSSALSDGDLERDHQYWVDVSLGRRQLDPDIAGDMTEEEQVQFARENLASEEDPDWSDELGTSSSENSSDDGSETSSSEDSSSDGSSSESEGSASSDVEEHS
ncbi:hypothetical protein AAVH_29206 [Aphelenchoides avenae]|nr:hypothetical protein AAVH_29206 [Aphelenchus avenae]